jgi:hypothetical protein
MYLSVWKFEVDLIAIFAVSTILVLDFNVVYFSLAVQDGCVIEVHMTVDDASETVARGTIHFSELLRFPQKKIHSTVPLATTRSHKSVVSFGIVHCWFQLRCSASHINNYMQHRTTDKVIQCDSQRHYLANIRHQHGVLLHALF